MNISNATYVKFQQYHSLSTLILYHLTSLWSKLFEWFVWSQNYHKMAFPFRLIIITNMLFFQSQSSFATDTITQSTLFFDGSILISKDGSFELGFFGLGSNSSNRYIGIWYKNILGRRIIWVANRDNPTKDNSSKLIINQDGNLLLLNHNESLVWSINVTRKTLSSVILQLLDNGNLVLRYENSNSNSNLISNLGGEEKFVIEFWLSMSYNIIINEVWMEQKTVFEKHFTAWRTTNDSSAGD